MRKALPNYFEADAPGIGSLAPLALDILRLYLVGFRRDMACDHFRWPQPAGRRTDLKEPQQEAQWGSPLYHCPRAMENH